MRTGWNKKKKKQWGMKTKARVLIRRLNCRRQQRCSALLAKLSLTTGAHHSFPIYVFPVFLPYGSVSSRNRGSFRQSGFIFCALVACSVWGSE